MSRTFTHENAPVWAETDHQSRTRAVGLTVNVTQAVGSIVRVIAREADKSESAIVRDALLALLAGPRSSEESREAAFKARLAAAAQGKPNRRSPKEAPYDARISTYLDADLHAELLAYCRNERLSPARAMRNAVDAYAWTAVREAGLGDIQFGLADATGVGGSNSR